MVGDKLINPIVGFYIPNIRIPHIWRPYRISQYKDSPFLIQYKDNPIVGWPFRNKNATTFDAWSQELHLDEKLEITSLCLSAKSLNGKNRRLYMDWNGPLQNTGKNCFCIVFLFFYRSLSLPEVKQTCDKGFSNRTADQAQNELFFFGSIVYCTESVVVTGEICESDFRYPSQKI